METIGAFEAKTHLASLLDRTAQGETFIITKHGTPVAQLVPIGRPAPEKVAAVVQRIEAIAGDLTLDGDWREFRDTGRKW